MFARLKQDLRQPLDRLFADMHLHLAAKGGDQANQQQRRHHQAQHQHGHFVRQERHGGVVPADRPFDIEEVDDHPGDADQRQRAPQQPGPQRPPLVHRLPLPQGFGRCFYAAAFFCRSSASISAAAAGMLVPGP